MKRQLILAVLVLGTACGAQAQNSGASTTDQNAAAEFSASPTENIILFQPPASGLSMPASTPLSAPPVPFGNAVPTAASPTPTPSPDPKFLYGGRDDFRWQLAIGADWMRFRSSIFNASAVGFKTSVTYFTNNWFGVEGNVTATFAPEIYDREHVKLVTYGGGPKIVWRERRWEPWAHAIFGGMHEQPQTAGGFSKHTWMIELGGGADYRFNPRLSGRLEGDWVRSAFFGEGQNNFELMGGIVFHF